MCIIIQQQNGIWMRELLQMCCILKLSSVQKVSWQPAGDAAEHAAPRREASPGGALRVLSPPGLLIWPRRYREQCHSGSHSGCWPRGRPDRRLRHQSPM